jgi:hypothetical protein
MGATVIFTPDQMYRMPDAERAQAMAWIRANGLDPEDISIDGPISLDEVDGQPVIRYHAFVRTTEGKKQHRPDCDAVWLEERTTPLIIPFFREPDGGCNMVIPRAGDYARSTEILNKAARWYGQASTKDQS